MPVLIAWRWFAALLLIVSLFVHASTFLGIDPMMKWPGVMFITFAVFPPFIAAFCYVKRTTGKPLEKLDPTPAAKAAPLWLKILAGGLFINCLVNGAVFLILSEGGGPDKRDGKYVLESHGTVLREISEEEYHRQRAYVVRGFSSAWIWLSCFALTVLVGAVNLRRHEKAPVPRD
jgi:hypothetical protein